MTKPLSRPDHDQYGTSQTSIRHHPRPLGRGSVVLFAGGPGTAYRSTGKSDRALECHQEGRAIQERLVAENPAEPDFAVGLTYLYNNIGNMQDEQRLYTEALKTHAKCLEVRERLVRENPGVADYSKYLAGTYTTLGHLYYSTDKPIESRIYHEKTTTLLAQLVTDNPTR